MRPILLLTLLLAMVAITSQYHAVLGQSSPANMAVSEPRSQPVADDSHAPTSKFTERDAMFIEDVVFGTDSSGFERQSKCPMDIALVWQNSMNTGIYATSLISHLYSDMSQGKQVIVPGFHRDLNILDHDGHHVPGSPINMASEVYFHSSPLLVDFNHDGIKDLVWVNVDAEIYVLNGDPNSDAAVMDYPWKIPKLKLKKNWYADLATKPTTTPPTASARRLMSVEMDDFHPLAIMRREKRKQYAQAGLTTRKALQAVNDKILEKTGVNLNLVAGRRLLEAQEDENEEEQEEEDESTNGEEPVPEVTEADEAHSLLAKLKAKYHSGHQHGAEVKSQVEEEEKQYLQELGLEMPIPKADEVIDDQEPEDTSAEVEGYEPEPEEEVPDELEGGISAGDQTYIEPTYADEPSEQTGDATADVVTKRSDAAPATDSVSAGIVGGGVDTSTVRDYTSPEIQAAVDELMATDPDFARNMQELGMNGQTLEDGTVDYTEELRHLAARHEAEQADILKRQELSGGIQLPEINTLPSEEKAAASNEHIASKDAMLAAERAAEAKKRMDLNSNVVRILDDKPVSQADVNQKVSEPDAVSSQIADGLTEEAFDSLSLFSDTLGSGKHKLSDYDPEIAWELAELDRLYPITDKEIWVDSHVLATPVLIDLTSDGHPELVMTVSYFFDDMDYHNSPALLKRLGADVNIKKYVAGALVIVDLWTHKILWTEHLDLSTDDVEMKAYIYASPTVIDLDGDGVLEIIVGTSLGLIYVFNSQSHQLLRGFPISMREIQAQIAVADVNQDGLLEMIAMDSKGNVLCFDISGRELWSTLISGFSSQSATFGDINGDGLMDVVIGTVSGHIWALNGMDGKVLPHFPLKTDGRIIAPITLVNLDPEPKQLIPFNLVQKGLHLVFPSFDGHVYIVDGRSGCTNKLDIGEHSYGMVLVDDILGRGKLDLLVTTMNGNVFCFSTEVDQTFHPLRSWPSQVQGLNGFTAREGYHGVYFTEASKSALRDIAGSEFEVEFVIVDERAKLGLTATSNTLAKPKYDISFRFAGTTVANVTHFKPGLYSHKLSATRMPQYTTIEILMKNEHQQFFHDEVVSGMNVHFYKTIKYMVIIPFLVMFAMMLLVKNVAPQLPV